MKHAEVVKYYDYRGIETKAAGFYLGNVSYPKEGRVYCHHFDGSGQPFELYFIAEGSIMEINGEKFE